jgi:hypothetical protein
MHDGVRQACMAVLFGLPLGGFCVGAALLVSGMGHGWGAPMRFGLLSLLFFPLAIFRLRMGIMGWRDDVTITLLIILTMMVLAVVVALLFGRIVPLGAIHMQGWILILAIAATYIGLHIMFDRLGLGALWGDVVLLGVALLCNIAIYRDATGDAAFGFRGNQLEIGWLAIWAVWQVIALIAFVRHLNEWQEKTAIPG